MRRRPSARRAGAFFLFFLVLLPVALMSLALAGEYAMTLQVNRQASVTAEAAAMAGATALQSSTGATRPQLDPVEARRRSSAMLAHSVDAGMLSSQRGIAPAISTTVNAERNAVTVTIEFAAPRAFITSFLTGGQAEQLDGTVSRLARICDPQTENPDPRFPEREVTVGCRYP